VSKELKKRGKATKGVVVPDRRADGSLVLPVTDTTEPEGV
jgi:hypothetical protein